MKEISIIIPCYNSLDTLSSTLSSIAMQSIKDKCQVYICNDCDGKDYTSIISTFLPLLNITYLVLPQNAGAGQARQYGIDNSTEPYIIFIDSDDTFSNAFAIELLYSEITSTGNDLVSGVFVSNHTDGNEIKFTRYEDNLTWLHGKIYSRDFIKTNKIRFNSSLRYDEDVCFNQVLVNCGAKTSKIGNVVCIWTDNSNSLTRSKAFNSRYKTLEGYVEANIYTFKETVEKVTESQNLIMQMGHALVMSYYYYNEISLSMGAELADKFLSKCKQFYKMCYCHIENLLTDDDLRLINYRILSSNDSLKAYFCEISFYDFCQMIGNS